MIVSIIGWYGTETLGDRAILDGILSVLAELEPTCKVQIGSLFKFYSQRTLLEEKDIFSETAPFIEIELFDIKDKKERESHIEKSELVIVGGGPLMDLEELFLIRKCFSFANELEIATLIMGCGVGPLNNLEYVSVVKDIFRASSKISLRDSFSLTYAQKLYGKELEAICLGDPAIISVENYKRVNEVKRENYIVVNFREYPQLEYGKNSTFEISDMRELLYELEQWGKEVFLVPMHTFEIGGDDRYFLSKVIYDQQYMNVKVVHKPMNLKELYSIYANAFGCIGMRYHSVLMQTILNGNNVIINYTDPNNGKIRGFINDVDKEGFYNDRILDIQKKTGYTVGDFVAALKQQKKFQYEHTSIKADYVEFLKEYF